MREAWFEVIKGARDRKGVSEAYKRRQNKKLAEKEALDRELENVTGRRGAIFDIKGKATPEKIRARIAEEKKLNREAASKYRKDQIKQGAKRVGQAITGKAKSGWKKLLQAGKKGAKALNPNTYLPDASATSGNIAADPSKYPNLTRLSQQPSRRMVLTPEEAEQREKDREAVLAGKRKEDARQNIFREFGEQGAELAGPKQKEQRVADAKANIFEQFGQQGAELQQQNYDKQLQAGLDAEAEKEQKRIEAAQKKRREELSRIADAQAKKEERAAKIKEMGEVNRQRKEAEKARREFKMPRPAALNQFQEGAKKKPLTFQQQLERKFGSPTGIRPKQPEELMITDIEPEASNEQQKLLGEQARIDRRNKLDAARARQAQKLNPENWKKLVAAQNQSQEQIQQKLQQQNPNMPKRQVPANAPPPKQPQQQTRQPTQAELQMSQQGQQQRKQTQAALQGQVASGQKRSAWQNVLQKPQAPPPKAPPTALNTKQQQAMEMFDRVQAKKRERMGQKAGKVQI